jgi:hypothetical protein
LRHRHKGSFGRRQLGGRSFLYELIAAGKIRKIKLGKRTLIDVPTLLVAVGARQMLDRSAA